MDEIRIATRRSPLALYQAGRVAQQLRDAHPDLKVALVEVETEGDRQDGTPEAQLGLGTFVTAVQHAVCDGRADAAVHSLKDLPTTGPDELAIAGFSERESPWDVVVGASLDELEPGALVGTGSPRRAAQLLYLRPDLRIRELRGNVGTRLGKVESGVVAAAIMAEAGLLRLDRQDAIAQRLTVDEMVPAPGQGALAVETIRDGEAAKLVREIDDLALRVLLESERLLLSLTGAGCKSALGALARWDGGRIRLDVFISDASGPRRATVLGDSPEEVAAAAREQVHL